MVCHRNLAAHRQIARKILERDEKYLFCHIQQHTSSTHSHMIAHNSLRVATERIPNYSTPHCRWKSHRVSRKIINQDGRLNHVHNTHELSNFHPRLQVYRMGYRKLLPLYANGMIRIYAYPYQTHSARYHHILKIKWPSRQIKVDIYGNQTRNLSNPTIGHSWKCLLAQRLGNHGYYQVKHTPGSWQHIWRPILFILVVNNFGIEYVRRAHTDHIMSALKMHYEKITTDW